MADRVIWCWDGRARLLDVDIHEGDSNERAVVDVADLNERQALALMLNLSHALPARHNGKATARAVRAVPLGPTARTGRRATPEPGAGSGVRVARPRVPYAQRAAQIRKLVAAHPGITRHEVLKALGIANPSGSVWLRLIAELGIRTERAGAGRGAKVRYYLDGNDGD